MNQIDDMCKGSRISIKPEYSHQTKVVCLGRYLDQDILKFRLCPFQYIPTVTDQVPFGVNTILLIYSLGLPQRVIEVCTDINPRIPMLGSSRVPN